MKSFGVELQIKPKKPASEAADFSSLDCSQTLGKPEKRKSDLQVNMNQSHLFRVLCKVYCVKVGN